MRPKTQRGFASATSADPAFAPIKNSERVYARDAITVGEFFGFTNRLPPREVIHKYPDGTTGSHPLQKIREELAPLTPDRLAYCKGYAFALTTMRTEAGWLCLEFSPAFNLIRGEIRQRESAIREDASAKEIVHALRRAAAYVDIGISHEQLRQWLADTWLPYRDFHAIHHSRFPLFTGVVSAAILHYRNSLDIWGKHRSAIPVQVIGGGFGVGGMLEGMATAFLIQSFIDRKNEEHANTTLSWMQLEWWYASMKTEVAHAVLTNSTPN